MKYFIFIPVLLLLTATISAQSDVSVKRDEFKTINEGFKIAWKHISDGNKYFSEGGVFFEKALDEYMMADGYNTNNAELNYKMGVASLYSDNKEKAAGYFAKAAGLKNDVAADILLLEGTALRYVGRYDDALEKLNIFLDSEMKKPEESITRAKKMIEECASAKEIINDTSMIEIMNIGGNINSESDDYSEVLTSDGEKLFFASRRAVSSNSKNLYSDTKLDENIFFSENKIDQWSVGLLAGKKITTTLCETPLFISNSGEVMYIYAGYEGNGDLKVSEFKKGEWATPGKESFGINSSYSETSFCISPKGDEIAFVSDRPRSGLGGKDIYIIRKIKDRKWSKPVNPGTSLNSDYNEESVRYSKTGDTLWFSSNGHNTVGGYDIFYSVRNSSGEWDQAVNAGYPLNTVWDELFYLQSPVDDSLFYFVSNRSGGFGGLDIYTGRILQPPVADYLSVPPPSPVKDTVVVRDTIVVFREVPKITEPELAKPEELTFTGKIIDSDSGAPLLARIEISDFSTEAMIATTSSSGSDGTFVSILPGKKIYLVDIRAAGYLPELKKIAVPESFSYEVFSLDFALNKVTVGKKVVLNNILFGVGNAVLTASSSQELDRLVTILQENPLMKIEISGHTDNTGNPVVNARLSTERARAVVDYVVSGGIDQNRLTYMGYGSEEPIADNATEAGRVMNRRVEFKILEF